MSKVYLLVRITDDPNYYSNEQIRCYGNKVLAQQECDRLNADLRVVRECWMKLDSHMSGWYRGIDHPAFYGHWNDPVRYSSFPLDAFLAEVNSALETMDLTQHQRKMLMPKPNTKHIDNWAFDDAIHYEVEEIEFVNDDEPN